MTARASVQAETLSQAITLLQTKFSDFFESKDFTICVTRAEPLFLPGAGSIPSKWTWHVEGEVDYIIARLPYSRLTESAA